MRLVQVGVGRWGHDWLRTVFPQVPLAQLVACVDSSPERRAAVVEEGMVPPRNFHASFDAALGSVSFDGVVVTTELSAHVPVVRAALEAGKHVLVEKPFAPSLEEARSLAQLAARRGLTLMVSQNYRFFPAVRLVQRLVAERTFGDVRFVVLQFRRFSPATNGQGGHHRWRAPLLQDMAVHHFDLLRATLGRDALSIACRTWNPGWSWFADDPEGCALISFEDGVQVSYSGSWLNADQTPWAGHWRMALDEGELWWTSRGSADGLGDEEVRFCDRRGTWTRLDLPQLELSGRAGCLAEFVDAVESGRTPECDASDNLSTMSLVYGAMASAAASGAEVELGTQQPAARER